MWTHPRHARAVTRLPLVPAIRLFAPEEIVRHVPAIAVVESKQFRARDEKRTPAEETEAANANISDLHTQNNKVGNVCLPADPCLHVIGPVAFGKNRLNLREYVHVCA